MVDTISQYILTIVPALTALIGVVVALGVGIGKIRKANRETADKVEEVSKNDKLLKARLADTHKENVELKKQLGEVLSRLNHVHISDKEE